MSRTGVVLFTRDLRAHDHAPLASATRECDHVVPLFVVDPVLTGTSPTRTAFLTEALDDLRSQLGGALVIRRGDPVRAVAAFAPDRVYLSDDVSPLARRRRLELEDVAEVRGFPGITIVPPGELAAAGSDHYRVFSPYWRAWRARPLPEAEQRRTSFTLPPGTEPGELPRPQGTAAADRPRGGETAARRRLRTFFDGHAGRYDETKDELGPRATSRLSADLHLGCLSPADVARHADAAGAEAFLRQLCWRDFFAQLLAARGGLLTEDVRPARGGWLDDPDAVDAWREGRTGVPIVDAGMRQLRTEGWLPGRARLIVASYLTKDLLVDWRVGARHFEELLVDGDAASNRGNWQWVAGTGTDTRPGRIFNPARQAARYDADGAYVRRHVPELASLPDGLVHDPPAHERRAAGYPEALVDHADAVERWRHVRRS